MKNCFGDFIHLQIERKIYYLLLLARRFVPGPVLVLLPATISTTTSCSADVPCNGVVTLILYWREELRDWSFSNYLFHII